MTNTVLNEQGDPNFGASNRNTFSSQKLVHGGVAVSQIEQKLSFETSLHPQEQANYDRNRKSGSA